MTVVFISILVLPMENILNKFYTKNLLVNVKKKSKVIHFK